MHHVLQILSVLETYKRTERDENAQICIIFYHTNPNGMMLANIIRTGNI